MTITNGWPPQAYTKETLAEAFEWLKAQPDNVKALAKDSSTLVSLYRNYQFRSQEGFSSPADSVSAAASGSDTIAPVSGEHFKTELKTLAEGLKEFAPSPTVNSLNENSGTAPVRPLTPSPAQARPQDFVEATATAPMATPSSAPMMSSQQFMHEPQPQNMNAYHPYVISPHAPHHRPQNSTPPPHVKPGHLDSFASESHNSQAATIASHRAQGSGPAVGGGLAALLDVTSGERIALIRDKMNLSSDQEALRMLISLGFARLKNILPVD